MSDSINDRQPDNLMIDIMKIDHFVKEILTKVQFDDLEPERGSVRCRSSYQ